LSAPADFCKTAAAADLPRLEAEVAGLAALRATATLRVPAVRSCSVAGDQACLVLERLDLRSLDRASGARLGEQLAALHRVEADRYGFASDNFIGDSPQANGWHREWAIFFATRRLGPQLRAAATRGLDRALVDRGESLVGRLAAFFVGYRPIASLLHGDLWGGNAGALPDGTPVVFDPAVYFGDREADLAMSELFGGFPESYYAAYRSAWPLDEGYETRKTLYNLYHVLNHFNLFGSAYAGQARRMIDSLLAELR
jgi:fructosamine-3-kinase